MALLTVAAPAVQEQSYGNDTDNDTIIAFFFKAKEK